MRAAILLGRLSDTLNRLALWGAVGAVVTMALAAAYQVVARYIFDAPPIWTEELARRAMVWAGMLGASVAFHERSDPTLFPGMAALTGGAGKVLALVRTGGVVIFAAPVLYYSLLGPGMNMARGFLGRSVEREAEMLGVAMAWFTAAVPIGFVVIVVHVVAALALQLAEVTPSATQTQEESPV